MPRESHQARTARMHSEYEILRNTIPDAYCALNFRNPFELLIATMLSAQTTDARVNSVTPELFDRFPTPEAMSHANPLEIEEIIRSIGFFRTKAQRAIMLSSKLVSDFHSEVPQTMDELVTLPGVGRKTANVVLGDAFNVPGFPVDTHVIRVTKRLHWRTDWRSTHPDPVHIEQEICAEFDPQEWTNLSHRLILFGRATCHARKPDCENCLLNATCPSYGLYT